MIIGLTGTYCAGKNFVAEILEKRGLPVLDVDKLGHQVLEIEKKTIFEKFGNDLQRSDGTLDRRLLGQKTYGNPEKLAELEAIVHPKANQLTEEWAAERDRAGDRACVINAALLHRSTIFHRLDCVIIVTAPFLTRLFRAKRRDRLSWRELLKRFAAQKDFNTQYLSINAEIYKVENLGLSKRSLSNSRKIERKIDAIIGEIR